VICSPSRESDWKIRRFTGVGDRSGIARQFSFAIAYGVVERPASPAKEIDIIKTDMMRRSNSLFPFIWGDLPPETSLTLM